MNLSAVVSRVLVVVVASVTPAIGCKTLAPGGSTPAPAMRGIDEPPPSHTGGLDVITVSPSGHQGPGASPGSHGDPVAEAIATGIGVATMGAAAARTAGACAQPDASPTCLRGPGPSSTEGDAGP